MLATGATINFAAIDSAAHNPPLPRYEGPTESLTHAMLHRQGMTEPGVTRFFWGLDGLLAMLVVAAFAASRGL